MINGFKDRIKNKQTFISFVIVFLILAFLFYNANISELIGHLKNIRPLYFFIGIGVFYLSFIPRGIRYHILLKNIGINQKKREITEIYFLSWFANLITPARLGDLYRSYLLKKNYGYSKSQTLGATFIERMIDLFFLIIFISIFGFLIFKQTSSQDLKNIILIAYSLLIVILICIVSLKKFKNKLIKLLPKKYQHVIPTFEKNMSKCITKKSLFGIIFLTVLFWTIEISTFYFVALALNTTLSITLIIFITLVSTLTSLIPLTPSGAGATEAGQTAALVFAGITYNLSFAISILHRIIDYWSGLIVGPIIYLRSKLK